MTRRHRTIAALAVAVLVYAIPSAATLWSATYNPHLTTRRAGGEITIDGRLDDPGWRGIPRATNFAEHNPGDQVQPPVRTEALLTYDAENLYVAFICQDDPALVRASLCERDNIFQDDFAMLCLDTFGDQSWAYEIAANPLGIQGDLLWSANGGEDSSYELVYSSEGRITEDGWQVEMAIPLANLHFPDTAEQTWRVDFWRNHPRAVRAQYSWAAYDREDPCWPCKWGTVDGISDLAAGSGLSVLPAFVASQSGARDGDDDSWHNADITGDFGVSATWDVSAGVSAEASYNPDFSQVESDAAQIDVNSNFALFYPERRPFFQEGSDLFHTYFNAVYTRSINNPLLAGKLIGRPGRTNVAYLVARDENTPFLVPFEERSEILLNGKSTSNILRAQQALGDNSHLGVVATDRRIDGGGSNTVLGADARIRLGKSYQIEFQALGTFTEEPDDTTLTADFDQVSFDRGHRTAAFDGEFFRGHALYASLERQGRHFGFDLDFWQRSPTFRADNGFEFRNDMREGIVNVNYRWYREAGLLHQFSLSSQAARIWNFDGRLKDEWVALNASPHFRWAQTSIHAQIIASNENYRGIQFDDIWTAHVCGNITPASWLRGGGYVNYGDRIARGDRVMGRETSWGLWAEIKPVDRLTISPRISYLGSSARADRIEDGERVVADGDELYDGFIARARATFQATREFSLRLVVQYDDFSEHWEADPLISYRLNPFSIFYVGSTRDYDTYDTGVGPDQEWRLSDRQYFLKVQYLFGV